MIATPSVVELADRMKRHAETGLFSGRESETNRPYFRHARSLHKTGVCLIFTRDTEMHSCGWFKNPDYERCFHLSVSFFDPETMEDAPFNRTEADQWARLFFGDAVRLSWFEPHVLPGKDVGHYRVLCNPKWQPIKPRGEVYSREFTEKGWQSWSEQQSE